MTTPHHARGPTGPAGTERTPTSYPSSPRPLVPSSPRLRPIGDWRWSLPAVRAAFPISSSAPSQTPARVMAPRLPPSPLCAESVAFAIDVEASAPQPGGTRWDGRMSMPFVAGVPASTTRTTVGEEARTRRVASFHCLTSIPPSTMIESLRLYRAVAKVLTERATRHDAACPPQAGMAQRVQCHSGSSMAPSSRPHVGGQQVQTCRCRELQRTRARRCRLEETTNTVQ